MQPEVILDRYVKAHLRNEPGCSRYVGKLDIERAASPLFRAFLSTFQNEINEALRLENTNASGGVKHPPFHFDYIDAVVGKNAHAFQNEEFSFIVVTLPLVESILDGSQRLSSSPVAVQLLHLDSGTLEPDILRGFLAQIQLMFLISHEYTHHIRHLNTRKSQSSVWSEFSSRATCGNIDFQAQELEADGYAAYLTLTHLLRGERRQSALIQLEQANMPATDCDELLLSCFFLAVLAFFCMFWHGNIDASSVHHLTHPPPPVRIKYAIKVAEMWCCQFDSVPSSRFSPSRLQDIFCAAADAVGQTARQSWDTDISFLSSADGARYDSLLFEKFEAIRQSE